MREIIALLSLSVALSGCASYVTVMKHPQTGDVQKCEFAGAGLIPMALAEDQHDKCVKQLNALGYKPTGTQ